MSYSCADQSDRLIELLASKGYAIYHGDGYNTRAVGDELPEPGEDVYVYDERIDGFWFTWAAPGGTEVGETYDSELAAWTDAMEHWFANAAIALHKAAA